MLKSNGGRRSPFRRALVRTLMGATAIVLSTAATAQPPTVPPLNAEKPLGPVAGTLLTKDYVTTLATLAYVWGWPLVNMHNRHVVFSKVPENGLGDGVLPVAPLNRLTMLTDYIKPEERAVATPNQDTTRHGLRLWHLLARP
jgi:hypothetical protein